MLHSSWSSHTEVQGLIFDSWIFGWAFYTAYMKVCFYVYVYWVTLFEALVGMDWYEAQN